MSDFIKSDYCTDCGGTGYINYMRAYPRMPEEIDQCPTCVELHEKEVRADRMFDELKEMDV